MMSTSNGLQCIIITPDTLEVLDQTLLPNEIKYVKILTLEDAWKSIKDMQVRGAPLIAVVALQGLKIELLRRKEEVSKDLNTLNEFLVKSSEYLISSRPTAVNLSNDLKGLLEKTHSINDLNELLESVLKYIQSNYDEYASASLAIANHGADIILNDPRFAKKPFLNILTICNTGKLAMPGVGTALGIIREINNRKRLNKLFIPETRPYNQGSRLTAFEAVQDNLPGTLITDSMVGILMRNKMVDLVIVGADRVTKLGYTANKIGTFAFSVIAKHHNVPFYVACPISTIDMNMTYGSEIVIEERHADEMRKIQNLQLAPKEINVWNPAFDVTPPNLIESIITEKGAYDFNKSETESEWKKMSFGEIEDYLRKNTLLEESETVEIKDVADGNLNYVYWVKGSSGNELCVKQALPWVKCVGEHWPLDLKRILFESEGLKYHQSVCENLVPKHYLFDEEHSLLVMEFLKDHIILRKGLMEGIKYKDLGKNLGEFVAKTCFYSSGLHIPAEKLRAKVVFWNSNSLCTLTEQVVFSDPYVDSEYNKWTSPQLDEIVKEFRSDNEVLLSLFNLRQKFINHKQALIHGDLHSGSIMVDNKGSCKVIDSEFAFYGPIGYDTGNVISHLLVSYFTQHAHKKGEEDYAEWILQEIVTFWETFAAEFINLWDHKEKRVDEFPGLYESNPGVFNLVKKAYMEELFSDTMGYCATEIIRRIFGIAHLEDFESIKNADTRSECEKMALTLARSMMKPSMRQKTIGEVVEHARKIRGDH